MSANRIRRKVTEFFGVAPNLLSKIDAQVWVSQLPPIFNTEIF
jgi:hypothetical protein